MENKRKAVDGGDRRRQRQRNSPEAETVDGRTATTGGNVTLEELPRVTASTMPAAGFPSGPSSQFGGALGRGTWHGVFAAPTLQPPVGNSVQGGAGQWRPPTAMSGTGHGGFSQSTLMVQPPVVNPAGGITPYGVPARIGNQMANPMAGLGRGGGTGFGHFAYGPGGFSLLQSVPLPTLGLGSPGECTICKRPTTGLWTATTVQGATVGTSLPLCDPCHSKIFTYDRPLRHLHQHLASTAVGCGAGSIRAYLASIGRHGGDGAVSLSRMLLEYQLSDPDGETAPSFGNHVPSGYGSFSSGQNLSGGLALSAVSPWCVVCNNPMDKFWDWLPMCQFCVNTAHDNREIYRARVTTRASTANANANARR